VERQRQAELIRDWMPWKQSTGPVTREGKAASAANRADHFRRQEEELRQARQELKAAKAKVFRLIGGKRRSIAEWASLADDLAGI
jgi:hypothetical protein